VNLTIAITDAWNILFGSGLGFPNPNEVRVFDATGTPTTVDFFAYGANQWGTNVASGQLTNAAPGTTAWEIVTGPGPGSVYGPHVRGWFRDGSPIQKITFFAYGTLRYGVNVASGNVDGESPYSEMVTGAGEGAVFGPHVRGWNFDANTNTAIQKINFFAYSTLKYGVNVDEGDVEGDCISEILTGPGPGAIFGPTVRGWNYDGIQLTNIAKININAFATPTYGANVSAGDVDADGYSEIVAAKGPGPAHTADYAGFNFDGGTAAALPGYTLTDAYPGFLYGGRVGLGDLDGDGASDLFAGAGRDPAVGSIAKFYGYNGSALAQLTPPGQLTAWATQAYGVNVAGAKLGY
jgi:hypothetical protein